MSVAVMVARLVDDLVEPTVDMLADETVVLTVVPKENSLAVSLVV